MIVSMRQAQRRWAHVVREAASGSVVVLTRRGEHVAHIVPLSPQLRRNHRRTGTLRVVRCSDARGVLASLVRELCSSGGVVALRRRTGPRLALVA